MRKAFNVSHKSVFVMPKGSFWQVKTAGSMRAFRVTSTHAEAIQIGRRIAMNNGYELIVRRTGGKVRSTKTTLDPAPPSQLT